MKVVMAGQGAAGLRRLEATASLPVVEVAGLSLNNAGPLRTFFRYICDNGAGTMRYDDLLDGKENPIDVFQVAGPMNGIELKDPSRASRKAMSPTATPGGRPVRIEPFTPWKRASPR